MMQCEKGNDIIATRNACMISGSSLIVGPSTVLVGWPTIWLRNSDHGVEKEGQQQQQ